MTSDNRLQMLNDTINSDNLNLEDSSSNSEPIPVLDSEEPSNSLPESEPLEDNTRVLLDKLESIPVFTIADEQGSPLVANSNGQKISGAFISQEDANQFVDRLKEERPELASQVRVIPIPLVEIYQLDKSQENTENDLDFAFIPEEEAVEDANSVGEEYQGGVPLFVAVNEDREFLTIEQNGQEVIPFFFDLVQLEETIAKLKEQQPEIADTISIEFVLLENVIETFETRDDEELEQIVLVPTNESRKFLQSINSQVDVYRFFNKDTGVHFYTSSETEKDSILANLPNYSLEGVSYEAVDPLTGADNSSVVHRFRNQNTGAHIYTIDETERSFIAENLSNYEYEGEAFAAYTSQVEGTIPIHRFYNSELDAHFYTPSETERESVENDLPNYDYEGIAYYAYPSDI